MPESSTSWLDPKTVVQLGATTVICVYLIFLGAQNIPETKALAQDILEAVGVIEQQHKDIGPKIEEGNRIQCAQCWNDADNQEEVKRCNCSPNR